VKDDKGDLVADSNSILVKWRNYFGKLLNAHEVSDIRQAEVHTENPLVPETTAFEIELAIENLKNHQVLLKSQLNCLKQAVGQSELRFINLLFLFGIRRNCLKNGKSRL
jgi:hypothetical protein